MPVSSRASASGSAERISASPIRTASTPTLSSSSSSVAGRDPALGDDGLAGGHVGHQLVGRPHVDGPLVEVAVVDPDHLGVELKRALELAVVVDLDQAVEVEPPRLVVDRARARRRSSAADDQQHRVGAVDRGLVQLVRIDDEVLAEDRQLARLAGGAQVVERAAEALLLGQDRERRGAAPLVGADPIDDLGRGGDVAGARRAALELGDHREARANQRLVERAVAAAVGQPRSRSACGVSRRRRSTPSRAAEMSCSIIPTGTWKA